MRDKNILKNYKREVSMKERIVKSKKIYSRKLKHKRTITKEFFEYSVKN